MECPFSTGVPLINRDCFKIRFLQARLKDKLAKQVCRPNGIWCASMPEKFYAIQGFFLFIERHFFQKFSEDS